MCHHHELNQSFECFSSNQPNDCLITSLSTSLPMMECACLRERLGTTDRSLCRCSPLRVGEKAGLNIQCCEVIRDDSTRMVQYRQYIMVFLLRTGLAMVFGVVHRVVDGVWWTFHTDRLSTTDFHFLFDFFVFETNRNIWVDWTDHGPLLCTTEYDGFTWPRTNERPVCVICTYCLQDHIDTVQRRRIARLMGSWSVNGYLYSKSTEWSTCSYSTTVHVQYLYSICIQVYSYLRVLY